MIDEQSIDELAHRVAAIEDLTYQRLAMNAMDMLSPARPGTAGLPSEPTVGFSPFAPATLIAAGVIDFTTLGSGMFVVPVPSTHAIPTKGTASSLPLSDHDHGLVKGPPTEALVVTYAGPGVPIGVVRTDTPGGVVATTVITYAGAQVASVVTARTGYTITVIPVYTGADITSIARTVA